MQPIQPMLGVRSPRKQTLTPSFMAGNPAITSMRRVVLTSFRLALRPAIQCCALPHAMHPITIRRFSITIHSITQDGQDARPTSRPVECNRVALRFFGGFHGDSHLVTIHLITNSTHHGPWNYISFHWDPPFGHPSS